MSLILVKVLHLAGASFETLRVLLLVIRGADGWINPASLVGVPGILIAPERAAFICLHPAGAFAGYRPLEKLKFFRRYLHTAAFVGALNVRQFFIHTLRVLFLGSPLRPLKFGGENRRIDTFSCGEIS